MKVESLPKPRTLKAFLVGDLRMAIGDITLTDKDTIEAFATAAYRKGQGSLKRLMQPKWKVVVVEENGAEHSFGLEKWNKLVSNEEIERKRSAAYKKACAKSAKLYGFSEQR